MLVKTVVAFIACLLCLTQASAAAAANAARRPVPFAVDLELVLAVDVSRSIDADEAALQRAGYVDAITHPDFIRAIKTGRQWAHRAQLFRMGRAGAARNRSCRGR